MAQAVERQAYDVLIATRDLFAATHWGKGGFSYWDDMDEPDKPGKQKYCAVGGLRFKSGHEPEQVDEDELLEDHAYAGALLALVEVLMEESAQIRERVRVYGGSADRTLREKITEPLDEYELVTAVELCQDIVIGWNDSLPHTSEEVVATFDKAVALVAPPQEGTS